MLLCIIASVFVEIVLTKEEGGKQHDLSCANYNRLTPALQVII